MMNILLIFEDVDEAENIERIIEDDLQKIIEKSIETKIKRNLADARRQLESKNFDLIILDFQFPIEQKSTEVIKGLDFINIISEKGRNIPSIIVVTLEETSNELSESIEKLNRCKIIIRGKDFQPHLLSACRSLLEDRPFLEQPNYAVITIKLNTEKNKYGFNVDGKYDSKILRNKGFLEIDKGTLNELRDDSKRIEPLAKIDVEKKKGRDYTNVPDISEIKERMDSFFEDDEEGMDQVFCMEGLAEHDAGHGKMNEWERELKKIGKRIVKEIFMNNFKFSKCFHRVETLIRNHKYIRFSFEIEKNIHPIPWEAMFEDDEDPPYYMLKSPIYRTLPIYGEFNLPNFDQIKRLNKINVLIIKSDVAELVPSLKVSFSELNNILVETGLLYKFLNKNRVNLNIGTIKVIDSEIPNEMSPNLIKEAMRKGDWYIVEQDFSIAIKETLQKGKWDLVHYAGHTYYDSDNKRGYVILPGKEFPQALKIEKFSAFLRSAGTQFIFLSSCHSSEEDFVYELAENNIPAIVGFRWDLDDRLAAKYALKFYHYLFSEKNSLEDAFLQTRKDMHDLHQDEMIWASPMMIKQC